MILQRRLTRPLSDLLEHRGRSFQDERALWRDTAVYVSLSSRTSPNQGVGSQCAVIGLDHLRVTGC